MGAAGGGGVKLKCFAGCDAAAIVAALGLTLADLFDEPLPDKPSSAPRSAARRPARKGLQEQKSVPRRRPSDVDRYGPKIGGMDRVAEYLYCDADGVVLGRVVRLEQRHQRGVVKTFIQEHPAGRAGAAWASGGWAPRGLYLLPVVVAAKRDREPILVCEGEKDVHTAVDAWGITATTNAGGSGAWTQTCTEQIAGAGPVLAVLDRDTPGYLRGLALHLELANRVGRFQLYVPAERDGIKDLTDHVRAGLGLEELVAVSTADLLDRMLAGGPGEAVKAARWVRARLADDTDLQALFGAAGPTLLRELATACADDRGLADELLAAANNMTTPAAGDAGAGDVGDQALADITPRPAPVNTHGGPVPGDTVRRPKYAIYEGEIVRRDRPAAADRPAQWSVLVGCLAQVERAEYADSGVTNLADPDEVPPTVCYVVRWTAKDSHGAPVDLGVQRVPADKWLKGEWLQESPAVAAGCVMPAKPGDRAAAAEAIRMLSVGLTGRTPIYTATGWRQNKTDGSWFYVHGGDGSGRGRAITATGEHEIRTDLCRPASTISFPTPADTIQQWHDGLAELTHLFDELPDRIAAVMIGLAARAALGWTKNSLLITGDYMAGKTSLATLLASFYDPTLPYDRGRLSLASSGSTLLGTRKIMQQMADSIALLDDANPDGGTVQAAKTITYHARAQAEQTDRFMAKRDGSAGAAGGGQPRGAQVMTAELSPSDAGLNSGQSRVFPIRIGLGEVSTREVLPDLHRRSRRQRRSTLLAGLISWMAGHLDDLREELSAYTEREHEDSYTRAFDAAGMPDRLATALADYAYGWRMWIRAAVDRCALNQVQAQHLWERAWSGLLDAGRAAMEGIEDSRYDGQLRNYLSAALASADGHLISVTERDLSSTIRFACGWKVDPRSVRDDGFGVLVPGGVRIGWVDEDARRVYLNPETSLGLAVSVAKRSGTIWDTTRRVVGAALLASGRSRPEVEHRNGREVRRSERRIRLHGIGKLAVWDVDLDWLMGEDGDDTPRAAADVPTILDGPIGGGQVIPLPVDPVRATAAAALPAAVAVGGEARAALPGTVSVLDRRPAPADSTPPAATATQETVRRHPIEVITPTFIVDKNVTLPPCETCGEACSVVFDGIPLHPGCEPPEWLTVTSAGELERGNGDAEGLHEPPADLAPADHPEPAPADAQRDERAAPEPQSVPIHRPAPAASASTPTTTSWVAVADVDGLWLPDGTRHDLPSPLEHAGQLVQAGLELLRDWDSWDNRWRPERPQIWMTAELVAAVGLPAELPAPGQVKIWRKLAEHRWLRGAANAGWRYGRDDQDGRHPRPQPWTTFWQDGGRGALVAIPSWTAGEGGRLHQITRDDHPTAAQLAHRIDRFATVWGLPYRWSCAVTGVERLQHLHRDPRSTTISRVVTMPEPFTIRGAGEREIAWRRPLTEPETQMRQLVGYDANAAYAAAANSLSVGLDVDPEHLTGNVRFDQHRPGTWRVPDAAAIAYPGDGLMPAAADLLFLQPDGSAWCTTPTLALLASWGVTPTIDEAWVWPAKARGARIFDTFVTAVREALVAFPRDGDPEAQLLRQTVKNVYTDGFGRLAKNQGPDTAPAQPWWRPDWNRAIVANAAARTLRTAVKVGQVSGRWPVAIHIDALYYAAPAGDPTQVAPEGLDLHPTQIGKYKVNSTTPIDELLIAALTSGQQVRGRDWLRTLKGGGGQ